MDLASPGGRVVITVGLEGPGGKAGEQITPAQKLDLAATLAPSMVRVEYTVQFDKGEAPGGIDSSDGPRFVRYRSRSRYGEQYVREERPMEVAGFLLSPTRVVTFDVGIHPRFIKKIEVRLEGEVVSAKTLAYATAQEAVILGLSKPLPGEEW